MSKTRDTGFLANVIQVHDTGVRIMSGSEMLMAISSSGAVTITGELSGSDAANSLLLDGTGSLAFTTTASFLVVSASQQQISSSLLQVSASYTALSGSYNTFSGSASTRTTQIENVYATTGSNSFRADQSITGSLVVSSTITAQTLVVQTVTSSIVYSSGSNLFGSALTDRQTFTGSMNITGSNHTIFGNVGIGTTPSLWANGTENSLQIKNASIYEYGSYETGLQVNAFYNTSVAPSGWKYISTGVQCLGQLQLSGGDLNYNVANPGTESCAITWNTKFSISRCGNVGIGNATTDSYPNYTVLQVSGSTGGIIQTSDGAVKTAMVSNSQCAGLMGTRSNHDLRIVSNDIERIRVTCAGRVGIGTCSPSTNFQVCGNISAENIAWIQNTNSGGYGSLRALNDINCAAVFGIGGSAVSSPYTNTGYIYTDPSINFSFSIGSSEKMRILSTGNVCIFCQISAGPVVIVGNQGGTDTTVITGGSGQGSSVRMNYAGGSYNNFLAGNGDNYFNCLLGKLNAAGGVKFGSGATTLNYYESGTWTPQIYWSNGGQYCMGGINGGNYVRIGNAVHLNFHLQWTAQCGGGSFGGTFRIGGIPFTVGSYRSAGTISAISSGIGRSDICITWHALTADPGANFIYWIENDARGGYSHSPNVSANGLAYSNQLTYTLQ